MLGSTKKLGTGVNVQNGAVAGHHLDIAWKRSDIEQRNERFERQGNEAGKLYRRMNIQFSESKIYCAIFSSIQSYRERETNRVLPVFYASIKKQVRTSGQSYFFTGQRGISVDEAHRFYKILSWRSRCRYEGNKPWKKLAKQKMIATPHLVEDYF